MSLPVVRQSEALIDEEQSRKINNRLSDQSVTSNKSTESFKDRNDLLSKKKKKDVSKGSVKNSMKSLPHSYRIRDIP
jgi:hypothetical protein